VDLSAYEIVPTEHSHAAAEKAVALARAGEVDAIMKGSLHTDELMGAVVAPAIGLTTDRRMSHVFIMDVPTYPPEAARVKGIVSPVAGMADILVVPDLESGNMLAKQLEYLADAQCTGIVLGARTPIVLTSRADSALSHMASCALALLVVQNKKKTRPLTGPLYK
jgi:phosphotransacetylase